jgi:UDP:flavonoid glycosyltransferase YjiC (YdhE family)
MRKKVLFVSERVTLAQLVRLVSLARALDPRVYEVHFASARFDDIALRGTSFIRHAIHSVSPEHVESALRKGRRIYDVAALERYVKDDLAVFTQVKPDVVVGDFRLSLAVSAPLFGVFHVALANAYFSPYAIRDGFPLPDHPMVKLLGEERAARHFPKAVPFVFAHFAKPVNDVRKIHGLSHIGSLLEVLTHADHVLYADTPSLVPLAGAPASHEFIGPVFWSPDVALPSFWNEIDPARPLIYVTLGSSGNVDALPTLVEALAALPVNVLLATAGRVRLPRAVPRNVYVTDFVPGDAAVRRSALVVTNGGSSTGYQALSQGVPVLGIPSNLDQYLAMTTIEKSGAGRLLRASTLSAADARAAATELLSSERHRDAAQRVKADFAKWSYADRFRGLVSRVTSALSPRALLATITMATALAGGPAQAQSPNVPASNEIRFSVAVDGNKGHLICALFRKDGWLKNPVQWKRVPIRNQEAECVFTSVAPDVYGISAFHDENDNQRLDTNFLGIPTEDWVTSRGAKAYFGPPSFDDAKFRYTAGVMRHRAWTR